MKCDHPPKKILFIPFFIHPINARKVVQQKNLT